jgi:uncharacterized membrane protein YqjE
MMDAPAAETQNVANAGPRAPLRGLVAAAIETLRTRVDLAATEFEMHLLALMRVLVWAFGAVTCILVALAFAVTALVVSLWDTHRMLALLGGSGAFVALAVLFGWLGARTLRDKPGMLEGTLQQLRDDQHRAGGRNDDTHA